MAQTPFGLVADSSTSHPSQRPSGRTSGDVVLRAVPRPRLCVLCGNPLRAGQHLRRVQGSTVHASCRSSSR
jgi:hypothetical protein